VKLTKQLISRDKKAKEFGDGPWLDEPDLYEEEYAGRIIMIARHSALGHLCGYVCLVKGDPVTLFRDDLSAPDCPSPDIYGGVTYSEKTHDCYVPLYGAAERVVGEAIVPLWWLGFDAAHSPGASPGLAMLMSRISNAISSPNSKSIYGETGDYWTFAAVLAETRKMATEINKMRRKYEEVNKMRRVYEKEKH